MAFTNLKQEYQKRLILLEQCRLLVKQLNPELDANWC